MAAITLSLRCEVTEDGSLYSRSGAVNLVTFNADSTITGHTDTAIQLIDKYSLNSDLEIRLRQNDKTLKNLQGEDPEAQQSPLSYLRSSLTNLAILNRNSNFRSGNVGDLLRSMIYGNSITAFESFFSDFVIDAVNKSDDVLYNLGENYADFKGEKFTLKELLTNQLNPKHLAIAKLEELSFHNLNTANAVYTAAFKINFPKYGRLAEAVENRHDIVHRNGYKIGAKHPTSFSKSQVFELFIDIQSFVITTLTEIHRVRTSQIVNSQ